MEQVSETVLLERFEAAVSEHMGSIRTFARNSVRQLPHMSNEDIEQELLVVLWKCVRKYDPDRGASFKTLFQGCARNQVISLIRSANVKSRKGITVSLDDEDVAAAIQGIKAEGSAEDWYFAIADHGEQLMKSMGSAVNRKARHTA